MVHQSAWPCSLVLRTQIFSVLMFLLKFNVLVLRAGLVQRTSNWIVGLSLTRADNTIPDRRGVYSAGEVPSPNWSCSARLGNKFNGWCCSNGTFEQDECTQCGYGVCTKHDSSEWVIFLAKPHAYNSFVAFSDIQVSCFLTAGEYINVLKEIWNLFWKDEKITLFHPERK